MTGKKVRDTEENNKTIFCKCKFITPNKTLYSRFLGHLSYTDSMIPFYLGIVPKRRKTSDLFAISIPKIDEESNK